MVVQLHALEALPLGKRPHIYCTEGWVGPRASMNKCRKSRRHRDSIPRPSNPYRVAAPTELSRLILYNLGTRFLNIRYKEFMKNNQICYIFIYHILYQDGG